MPAAENQTSTNCGLPSWLQIPSNDTSTFISNAVLGAINVPFCVWAFFGNLAVVIAVGKTPSLQRPSNILLCGLAIADCLSGLLAQPAFVVWRVMIYRIHQTCDLQLQLFWMYNATQYTVAGLSFANLTVMSCDRHYALAKPLDYRAKVTGKDAAKASAVLGTAWLLWSTLSILFLQGNINFYLSTGFGVVFFIVPIVNHIGILVAIRRHNNQVQEAISGQNLSILFRREKKAAVDMFLIMAALLLTLAPALIVNINEKALQQHFEVMYAWSACFVYINSSINPVIYLIRNGEIREAVKSLLRF